MNSDILFACVGKPSAGKSTFMNAITDAAAKMGNFPFTTIEPNNGVAHYHLPCPCKQYDVCGKCRPKYGDCKQGKRRVPVRILDVAGLVPGASKGIGLGNKFLDDLRTAKVLVHVVDVSGTTNELGQATEGYDPINDVEWLNEEIELWVFNNLWTKWNGVVRKLQVKNQEAAEALQLQVSGYGVKLNLVQEVLQLFRASQEDQQDELLPLPSWQEADVRRFVTLFVKVRFPTVLALNKIDLASSEKNIANLAEKYESVPFFLCSGLAELFLQKMKKKKFIHYDEGEDSFLFKGEEGAPADLRVPPSNTKQRLLKIRDLVLYRYGSTGCQEVIECVVNLLKLHAVFPVNSLTHFTTSDPSDKEGVFRDCLLLPLGSSMRAVGRAMGDERLVTNATTPDGRQLGASSLVTSDMSLVKLTFSKDKERR